MARPLSLSKLGAPRLLLAAYLGHDGALKQADPLALLALDQLFPKGREERWAASEQIGTRHWAYGLTRWGPEVGIRAAIAIARLSPHADGPEGRKLVEAAEAWLQDASPEAEKVAGRLAKRLGGDFPPFHAAMAVVKQSPVSHQHRLVSVVARLFSKPWTTQEARVKAAVAKALLPWVFSPASASVDRVAKLERPGCLRADVVFVPDGATTLGEVTVLARWGCATNGSWGSYPQHRGPSCHMEVSQRKSGLTVQRRCKSTNGCGLKKWKGTPPELSPASLDGVPGVVFHCRCLKRRKLVTKAIAAGGATKKKATKKKATKKKATKKKRR